MHLTVVSVKIYKPASCDSLVPDEYSLHRRFLCGRFQQFLKRSLKNETRTSDNVIEQDSFVRNIIARAKI